MTKGNVVPFVSNGKRAAKTVQKQICAAPRRLMSASEAAAYLGYKSPAILKRAGLIPVRLALITGDRGEPKYDRLELDALIERSKVGELRGDFSRLDELEDADDALMQWRLKRGA